jgi:hypothetical protein
MSDESQWVVLGSFTSVLAAEVARQTLEAEEIPAMVQSSAAAFGPGFIGPVAGGVRLLVPDTALSRAQELVGSDVG